MRIRTAALATAVFMLVPLVCPASQAAAPQPPATARRPVEDRYFGRTVPEDYRWLENWSDPEVRSWSESQNGVTRDYLDHLPDRPEILKRVEQLTLHVAPAYRGLRVVGGAIFAIKDQPPKQQPLLVRLESVDNTATETVLLDPNVLDPTGGTSMDFFEPSLDGSKVAVSLSKGGSESGAVHVYDARTGAPLSDVVPRVNGGTAGGSVAWNADGTGFCRTRYPASGERPDEDLPFYQQVYFHRLGTPADSDRYVIGREFPKIAEIVLTSSDDGQFLLVNVLNGDGGDHAFYLRGPSGVFRQLTRFADRVVGARFGSDALYLLSRDHAPNGKILRLPLLAATAAQARVVVPEGGVAIEDFTPTDSRLYVKDVVGGPSQVRIFDLTGKLLGLLPIPPVSSVGRIERTAGDAVLLEREGYTEPSAWYRYDPAKEALEITALVMRSPASFADVEVRREFATSKDGTRVPVNILMRKGTPLDGTAPTILYGYGGYGIVQRPSFSPTRRLWLEQGGIVVIANLRGGGEFGDAWHLAGNLTHKQNVFDDFAACARYLIDRHYTSPQRLACQGGSNGGLLMGAALTQHPELFRAVVSSVGIYDMLRVELSPNGLFNTTEFGTVKDSAQFEALYAYSPYHHVTDGVRYPAVLFPTGANDPRVDPMNSRKMTARLQAATASGYPVLLRTSGNVGHGIGSPLSERNAQQADIFAFLLAQLGVTYNRTAAPAP